jgi:hypothetical protein
MAFNLPPPPVGNDVSGPAFRDWFYKLTNYLSTFEGGGGSGDGSSRNVLIENTTIEEDTSYIVLGTLNIGDFTLTVNGNIGVL